MARGIKCFYCKTGNHIRSDCPERNAVVCVRCLDYGHTKNHCPKPIKRVQFEDLLVAT